MVEVLHHDVSLSVAGELELDDLYGSFQHKPFHNNTARNLCTVQILILQTTSNQYMKKYWLLVFFIQSKLYLPCWHLHAYMDVIGLGVFFIPKLGSFPPQHVCFGPSICSLPLRTTVRELPKEMSCCSAGAQLKLEEWYILVTEY